MGKGDRAHKRPPENELTALLKAFEAKYQQGKTDAERAAAARSAYSLAGFYHVSIPKWAAAEIEAIIARGFVVKLRRGEKKQHNRNEVQKRNLICMLWLHQLKVSLRMAASDAAIVVEEAFRHYTAAAKTTVAKKSSMPHMSSVQLAQMYSRDRWAEKFEGMGPVMMTNDLARILPCITHLEPSRIELPTLPRDLLAFAPDYLKNKYPIIRQARIREIVPNKIQ